MGTDVLFSQPLTYPHPARWCISAGRQTFLREACQYRIPLPRRSVDSPKLMRFTGVESLSMESLG